MATLSNTNDSTRGRLIGHFDNVPLERHASAWSELWDQGESDLWDRGCPSPSLVDLLEHQPDVLNPIAPSGRRKRALVPGCGRGYDVILLALHGFDAYGLEISPTAVATGKEYAISELKEPSLCYFSTPSEAKREEYRKNRGEPRFLQGNFFESDWDGEVVSQSDHGSKFDLVYDYTVGPLYSEV
ncbi:hypothetical protein FGG08_007119 [Glutinoglossum americanum]|uniref:Thiol methyltransferase n=1 Tax=Glutinoglossum americanum TaxID=1670608 RepID=A0A9P8L198_9PEZI|nr:hypothetical protein FGG08_007119 [Glutinoglossum americanum]